MRYPDELFICIPLEGRQEGIVKKIENVFKKNLKLEIKRDVYRSNSGITYCVESVKGPTWSGEAVIKLIRSK